MKRSRGAVAVEFALVVTVLLLLLFGLIELGRAIFKWNSATEATRVGARMAAISAVGDKAAVLGAMNTMMAGELQEANVELDYSVNGVTFGNGICIRGTCQFVRVRIAYTYRPAFILFQPAMSLLPETITMPSFATTFPVEALGGG
ncbi:TadE/TadG family type IV pilus assembly protein [Caenimonas sp. SL110]|uniref:TadE/TadG family type IV pilus assembly protein n=1 Tax=Caenimonas sp. SL110 TaxID=1450524 RepID=UPI0006536B85|nr:TadE/TadG family type IV pilus assembly protein [Caenimonas sp. SL110]